MESKEIKELINLMNEHGLIEIEVEKEGQKIRLKKSSPQASDVMLTQEGMAASKNRVFHPAGLDQTEAPTQTKSSQIKSPMIGTFYRSPHPDSAPFIEIGDVIEPGRVICIIEAMKLMNEIKSEIKGKVVQILVNSGDPVEFGQPLFSVQPL